MAVRISELQGVTPEIAAALKGEGLNTSDQLLAAAAQPQDRSTLAGRVGIAERALLELANRADLARIKGVGRVYSDLLEFAGVDTVSELATRNADNLFTKLTDVAAKHHVVRLPRLADVKDWVAQAGALGRAIYY